MNRENFIKEFETKPSNIDKNQILNSIRNSIDSNLSDGNPRGHRNLIIVMEELAELSQAISKELRGKGDSVNLLEELADVQLGILYVQEICNISDEDINKAINVKIERLEKVLKDKKQYQ